MRRRPFALGLTLAAAVAAGPRLLRAPPRLLDGPAEAAWVGSFHAHTTASHDGRVDRRAMAAAAAAARLDFVVLTEHNVQAPSSEQIDGIWLLSFAELSTRFGHVVGLGAPRALSAQDRRAADVLARIAATGARPIVTHPTDPKNPWTGAEADLGAAGAGLELANSAAAARRLAGPSWLGLVPVALALPLNPDLAMAQLYRRDDAALALWDRLPVAAPGLCGTDSHGAVPLAANLPHWKLLVPRRPMAAAEVPAHLIAQLAAGRATCVAGALAHAPQMVWEASAAGERPPHLALRLPAAVGAEACATLYHQGRPAARGCGARVVVPTPAPGLWRAEVDLPVPGLMWGRRRLPVMLGARWAWPGDRP